MKMKTKSTILLLMLTLILAIVAVYFFSKIPGMGYKDAVPAVGLLFGPILAVIVTRINDNNNADYDRKLSSFRELMRYRCDPTSREYVCALNLIAADFDSDISVQSSRKTLLQILNTPPIQIDEFDKLNKFQKDDYSLRRNSWFEGVRTQTATLLSNIGSSLGVDVAQIDIMETYIPNEWFTLKNDKQNFLRSGLAFFSGMCGSPYINTFAGEKKEKDSSEKKDD